MSGSSVSSSVVSGRSCSVGGLYVGRAVSAPTAPEGGAGTGTPVLCTVSSGMGIRESGAGYGQVRFTGF